MNLSIEKVKFENMECEDCKGTGKIPCRIPIKNITELECDECAGTGKRNYDFIQCTPKTKIIFNAFIVFNVTYEQKENECFRLYAENEGQRNFPFRGILRLPLIACPSISSIDDSELLGSNYFYPLYRHGFSPEDSNVIFKDKFYVSHECGLLILHPSRREIMNIIAKIVLPYGGTL